MTEILVQLIEGSSINNFILSTTWLWPFLEILHFIGLSLLLGSMLVIDVHLAGYAQSMNVERISALLPIAVIGFFVNALTGLLFFLGDPARYTINIGFQLKMLLIAIAGINALLFVVKVKPDMQNWNPYGDTSKTAKAIAYISLLLWFSVLLLGRLIPYVGTG